MDRTMPGSERHGAVERPLDPERCFASADPEIVDGLPIAAERPLSQRMSTVDAALRQDRLTGPGSHGREPAPTLFDLGHGPRSDGSPASTMGLAYVPWCRNSDQFIVVRTNQPDATAAVRYKAIARFDGRFWSVHVNGPVGALAGGLQTAGLDLVARKTRALVEDLAADFAVEAVLPGAIEQRLELAEHLCEDAEKELEKAILDLRAEGVPVSDVGQIFLTRRLRPDPKPIASPTPRSPSRAVAATPRRSVSATGEDSVRATGISPLRDPG